MAPLARRLYFPSFATAAFGAALATSGVLRNHYAWSSYGMLILVAAVPAICYCLTHRATQANDERLAETHRAGYRLALHHVSMGLLEPPSAPPDGGEGVEEDDAQKLSTTKSVILPDNVRPIRSHDDEMENDRKAV
ncbi:hypothetical protein [Streptomyces sp. NPDC017941]|uniref:hypothetical protein n=1 Tax=unclassified Streptomyces TaxID=2593676 RepID=UPI00379F5A83